jgi:hypothetical protein
VLVLPVRKSEAGRHGGDGRWWLERYSLDEIRELAADAFG